MTLFYYQKDLVITSHSINLVFRLYSMIYFTFVRWVNSKYTQHCKPQLQLGCLQGAKLEILAECSSNVLQQLIQHLILMCPDINKCIQNMPNISRYILFLNIFKIYPLYKCEENYGALMPLINICLIIYSLGKSPLIPGVKNKKSLTCWASHVQYIHMRQGHIH